MAIAMVGAAFPLLAEVVGPACRTSFELQDPRRRFRVGKRRGDGHTYDGEDGEDGGLHVD